MANKREATTNNLEEDYDKRTRNDEEAMTYKLCDKGKK